MFKKKKQEPAPEPPKDYKITLTDDQFWTYVVEYETGKIPDDEILIFMCYISERLEEISERYYYPHLFELMDYQVIEGGLVNPQKLNEYKNK